MIVDGGQVAVTTVLPARIVAEIADFFLVNVFARGG
jgi:hypothetical protein